MTYRPLIRVLERDGWYVAWTTSPVVMCHPDRPGSVPVPNHPGKQARPCPLHAILSQTDINPERLRALVEGMPDALHRPRRPRRVGGR